VILYLFLGFLGWGGPPHHIYLNPKKFVRFA
jgi:hypothetical protein